MCLALAAVALVIASLAWADGCRLSMADCGVIAKEMANARVSDVLDAQTFTPGMPSGPRGRALIERQYERRMARLPHPPTRIGDEMARMELCDAHDNARALRERALALPLSRSTAEALAGPPVTEDPRCRP